MKNFEPRVFEEMEFASIPDPLFAWTKEEILAWGKKRLSENPEEVSESYRMTAYYNAIYHDAARKVREGQKVKKPYSNFEHREHLLPQENIGGHSFTEDEFEDVWGEISEKITDSPCPESYEQTVPFSESCKLELDKRDARLEESRRRRIYEKDYEFDPDKFLVDRKIPKGGILQALRDSCK